MPPNSYFVFKSATSVHELPFQVSHLLSFSGEPDFEPAIAIAAVLSAATPPHSFVYLFKSPVSVQLVPFQISVFAVSGVLPPKDKAAVAVPVVIKSLLPEFRSLTSVHEEPSQLSVFTALGSLGVGAPEKTKPLVFETPAAPLA